jgi:hypothetical protein
MASVIETFYAHILAQGDALNGPWNLEHSARDLMIAHMGRNFYEPVSCNNSLGAKPIRTRM